MKTQTILCVFLIFVGVLLAAIPVVAQQPAPPNTILLLQIKGDLWLWKNGRLQQRTNWGYNQTPILSPDGKLIAYKSTASLAVDQIKRSGPVGGGDLPANLWLMDAVTGDATRIADQPDGASFLQKGAPDRFIIRSTPTFSPDSRMLAWTELLMDSNANPDQAGRLVIYNIAAKSQKIVAPRLPPQYGVPTGLQTQWGATGIAVWSITGAADSKGRFATKQQLLLFDQAGQQLAATDVGEIYEFSWVKDGDRDYVATLGKGPTNQPLDQTQGLLIDPLSGKQFGMPGVPEMYSLTAPDGLSLFASSGGAAPDWQIGAPNKSVGKLGVVDDVYVFSHVLALSPDGQQVAYIKQGAAYIYANGTTTKLATSDVSTLAWGPVGWRVRRSVGP